MESKFVAGFTHVNKSDQALSKLRDYLSEDSLQRIFRYGNLVVVTEKEIVAFIWFQDHDVSISSCCTVEITEGSIFL